ncbi:MAG TPA: DUF4040 domain-containing protein [Clostridia bacterium]|nr:DUF4040 domain-containing protein [Clostridia bacterium]HPQ46538.1 DUF4040 domain-containing protein [Clostridia bacterium]HRX42438.1 DUF4040 domain-containing protein [Clostridia bacterium]
MMPMVEKIMYIALIVFAFMSVQTPKLRQSVVYLAVFSAGSAFVYVLLGAPDAALAEAVIGSTIATIIYLSALQKYKVFTVYYTNEMRHEYRQSNLFRRRNAVLQRIEKFCSGKDLEAHIMYTTESLQDVMKNHGWDIIVRRNKNKFSIYGLEQNYHTEEMQKYIEGNFDDLRELGYEIELYTGRSENE